MFNIVRMEVSTPGGLRILEWSAMTRGSFAVAVPKAADNRDGFVIVLQAFRFLNSGS